ncbi:fatty acid metabolism transcriptional regulator FadR [Chloroflexota bacterium]|nr:fatty acid metabolism transcriptional regulator FadR [Chloroflexota bacterium]
MTTYQSDSPNTQNWKPIKKPAELVESRLIEAILDGTFPANSHLPAERELAESLGVTRPTLREALQRLTRDGWVEIHHGKPTRVRDYLTEGNLGVLNALAEHPDFSPDNFVPNLLTARLAMAPLYTLLAVENAPNELLAFLERRVALDDSPREFADFDWSLHHTLTILSGNPIFVLILNGFKDLYLNLAPVYFNIPDARQTSRYFYDELAKATQAHDSERAKSLTESIMRDSLRFWQQAHFD